MKRVKAFFSGMREYRSDFTQSYSNPSELYAYDLGRDWAHRLTFRIFD